MAATAANPGELRGRAGAEGPRAGPQGAAWGPAAPLAESGMGRGRLWAGRAPPGPGEALRGEVDGGRPGGWEEWAEGSGSGPAGGDAGPGTQPLPLG